MTATYTITSPLHGTQYQTIKVLPKNHTEKLSTKYHFESPYRAILAGHSGGVFIHANYRGRHVVWKNLLTEDDYDFAAPVLDLGSGSGVALMKICQRKRELEKSGVCVAGVTAVDNYTRDKTYKRRMKKIINNIKANEYTDLVTLDSADLTNLPYSCDTFSVVTCPWALKSYDQNTQRHILREMARVCKPGGRLLITDLSVSSSGPFEEWIRDMGWLDVNRKSAGANGWFGYWSTSCYKFRKPEEAAFRDNEAPESLLEDDDSFFPDNQSVYTCASESIQVNIKD